MAGRNVHCSVREGGGGSALSRVYRTNDRFSPTLHGLGGLQISEAPGRGAYLAAGL